MLGDIYLGAALAIFLAIFGWSESIFGLSQKTKENEAVFIRKSGLTLSKYIELRKLISHSNNTGQAEYTKRLVNILKGTKIGAGDKGIFDKLRENNIILSSWENFNKVKKLIIGILFIYLFISGTIILLFENGLNPFLTSLNNWIIILQIILFIIICFGVFIYSKISKFETEIQNNLNDLMLRTTGEQ